MPEALQINKDDPQFNDFPDFAELRQLGIDYISEFSGKLWTDHNLHDPGITILEVLCYALTDLGYRTSLPIEELLAPNQQQSEDNFFTPEQILTCNPVTILDLRRMLVDIEGIRNAWVVPAESGETPLHFTPGSQQLSYEATNSLKTGSICEDTALHLKGLYRVLLDVDPVYAAQDENCSPENQTLTNILRTVYERLHQHRNLCEDFTDIKVLQDEPIQVCTDLELNPTADPAEVLLRVYEAIEKLIAPRLEFHTLPQLLAQGKSITDIYAGRPYTPAYERGTQGNKRSHGFVDIDALRESELPTNLLASDFYRVIMGVEGVRAIRQLSLRSALQETNGSNAGQAWQLPLTPDHRPVFSPEGSVFKFFKGVLRIPFSGFDQVQARFRKRLADFRKIKYTTAALDNAIPYGIHREDVDDYYSIQHEFPTVYGIGEGDLLSDSPTERKVQALQLKGYLSFFDQLLANYLSQLAEIRSLFALHHEGADMKGTYFSQVVENIPELEKLLRFYEADQQDVIYEVLLESSQSFDHPASRDQAVEQLVQLFSTLNVNELRQRIRIEQDDESGCHLLSVRNTRDETILVSPEQFPSSTAAQSAVQRILFMGIVPDNYELVNRPSEHVYSFRLLNNPGSYANFLQEVVETPERFVERRDQFLNHLLARFGEQFTDYVLLMYALNQERVDDKTIIKDKERFLRNYPLISRNRGRAFNYRDNEELWNSKTNLTGLELRVSHLMGIPNWSRQTLNPFRVELRDQGVRLLLRDHRERVILRSTEAFTTETAANVGAQAIMDQLCNAKAYELTDCCTSSVYGIRLSDTDGKPLAVFDRTYPTTALRDKHLHCLQAYFCEPLGLLVEVTQERKGYGFVLKDETATVVLVSLTTDYATASAARLAGEVIVAGLRKKEYQLVCLGDAKKGPYIIYLRKPELTQGAKRKQGVNVARHPDTFTDKLGAETVLRQLEDYFAGLLSQPFGIQLALAATNAGYFYQVLSADQSIYLQSSKAYETEAEACQALLHLLVVTLQEDVFQPTEGIFAGGIHSFSVVEEGEELAAHPLGYAKPTRRNTVLDEVRTFLLKRRLDYRITQEESRYFWVLGADQDFNLCSLIPFSTTEEAECNWQIWQEAATLRANYEVERISESEWQAYLIREDGLRLAATTPVTDPNELEEELANFISCIADLALRIQEETGEYYFVLRYHEQDVLFGTQRFNTAAAAECAFRHFSLVAADPDHYQDIPELGTCRLGFGVKVDDKWLATHPYYREESELRTLLTELQAYVQNNLIPFAFPLQAGDWYFQINWENCQGKCENLLTEVARHPTREAAKVAAREFLEQGTAYPEATINEETGYFGFHWLNEAGVPLATHLPTYATAWERDAVLEDVKNYLAYYQDLSTGQKAPFQQQDQWWICGKSPSICGDLQQEKATPNDLRKKKTLLQSHQPLGGDCLLSGFKLRKDASPVAVHPVCYDTAAERDEVQAQLMELGCAGAYRYSELCLQKSDAVVKKDHRFYYQWQAETSGGTEQVLWRSIQVFDTDTAAYQAFQQELMPLIEAARWTTNYKLPTADESSLQLLLDGEPKLYWPGTLDTGIAEQLARQEFALLFPVERAGKDRYYYRIYDVVSRRVWWRSGADYPTLTATLLGLKEFIAIAQNAANYQRKDQADSSIYELVMLETLLVSRRTYADELIVFTASDEAEAAATTETAANPVTEITPDTPDGNAASDEANSPTESLKKGTASRSARVKTDSIQASNWALKRFGNRIPPPNLRLNFPNLKPTLQPSLLGPGLQINFANTEPDRKFTWRSRRTYSNVRVANLELRQLQELFKKPNAFAYTDDAETGTRIAYRFTDNPKNGPTDQDVLSYVICPAEYEQPTYDIEGGISIPVSDFCAKDPAPDTAQFCPKAWDVGLQDFLIYGTDKTNYYSYLVTAAGCRYSFRVVTDRYRVARHPREFHTPTEREHMLDWLYHYGVCEKAALLEPYQPTIFSAAGKCYYKLCYEPNTPLVTTTEASTAEVSPVCHWQSYQGYASPSRAAESFQQTQMELYAYAQQLDCYSLIEIPPSDNEGNSKYRIALQDDQGAYVLISPQCYEASDYEEAIRQRILWARRYPFFRYQEEGKEDYRYGFQCYSITDLPDVQQAPPAENCHADFAEPTPNVNFALSAGSLLSLEVPGEVIWESIHEYDSVEEVECAFKCFVRLLTDRNNYQRRQLSDCNLFSLEITHPERVLADHPRTYATQGRLQGAIEQTLACINGEGFHLVEHILLRPRTAGSHTYTLRFRYPVMSEPDEEGNRCLEGYDNQATWPGRIYRSKEEAALAKADLLALLTHALERNLIIDETVGTETQEVIVDRTTYRAAIVRYLQNNSELKEKVAPDAILLLAEALAREDDATHQFFADVFLRPCLGANGYQWLYRAADGDSVNKLSYTFVDCATAEQKLQELLNDWEQKLVIQTAVADWPQHRVALRDFLVDTILTPLEGEEQVYFTEEEATSLANALLTFRLHDALFCFRIGGAEEADALIPNCPDCENAEILSTGEASPAACAQPELPLPKSETEVAVPPGSTIYVPGADPYSFWATVVLPYWPRRFQNINFRRFFEDTLRREAPAHVALRICWLDPRQMFLFDRYYHNWLVANQNAENCELQMARRCLIDLLFSMTTVYPPARLEGGDRCTSASTTQANAVLIDATQMG